MLEKTVTRDSYQHDSTSFVTLSGENDQIIKKDCNADSFKYYCTYLYDVYSGNAAWNNKLYIFNCNAIPRLSDLTETKVSIIEGV